jgi:alanine-glyoxylate transaminase/serine-glyoxylate transaminase/serine-pyruvate transaminase
MKGRKLLMIPGPIEFEPEVLRVLGAQTTSHVAHNFIAAFGNCIRNMREVWQSFDGQPFVVSGSGTLAMDMAASNLIENGDNALVISTGYFGTRYKDILERYGANVTVLDALPGHTVAIEAIEEALKNKIYKLLTFTHVDTSTGVFVSPKPIADLAKKYNVLSVLDGVCSVAGEEIKQEEWGLDVVLTASQKAIGVPPGLALLVASKKAMTVWEQRKTVVSNYYCDWQNWLPVMKAYEEGKPSYFGTPPVNLIFALEKSLEIIVAEGIEERVKRHKNIASAFRKAITSLGLKLLPINNSVAANTLSAIYYPKSVNGGEFCAKMAANDIIVAGGLLPELKTTYFRVGHMGSVSTKDMIATLSAIESALNATGFHFKLGDGLKVFQQEILSFH